MKSVNATLKGDDGLERLSIEMDILIAEQRARMEYRERAVQSLLGRVADMRELIDQKTITVEHAMHMIECAANRIRMIDEMKR